MSGVDAQKLVDVERQGTDLGTELAAVFGIVEIIGSGFECVCGIVRVD